MRTSRLLAAAFAVMIGVAGVPERAGAQAGDCIGIEDDELRLQCYDRAAGAGSGEPDTAASNDKAVESVAAEEATADATDAAWSAESAFGRKGEQTAREEPPDQIQARIIDIETKRYGARIITLDNGHVWAEKSSNRGLILKRDDVVTIKSGWFGSYKLFGSGNRFSKVERIR